jgi:hypothetical protein
MLGHYFLPDTGVDPVPAVVELLLFASASVVVVHVLWRPTWRKGVVGLLSVAVFALLVLTEFPLARAGVWIYFDVHEERLAALVRAVDAHALGLATPDSQRTFRASRGHEPFGRELRALHLWGVERTEDYVALTHWGTHHTRTSFLYVRPGKALPPEGHRMQVGRLWGTEPLRDGWFLGLIR